jgi:putative CocE/NonD family hydrolase
MRDGVHLATDIYLPAAVRRCPAILTRTPYDKCHVVNGFAQAATSFTEHGYAFVVQDIRGKARSEDQAEAFIHDVTDSYDTLDWLQRQSWSNGSVAMWGESYMGFTQWAAAAAGHPALKAIVPIDTASHIEDWFYRQGVFELLFAAPWAARTFSGHRMRLLEAEQLDWTSRPLRDILTTRGAQRSISFDRWVQSPPDSAYWRDGVYGLGTLDRGLAIPALHMGGWWDCFKQGQIRDWMAARVGSPCPQFLFMGATDHSGAPDAWPTGPDGALSDPNQFVTDRHRSIGAQLREAIVFLDFILKGGSEPLRVRFQRGAAGWEQAATWPPPAARPYALYLGGDGHVGTLCATQPLGREWATWTHDPGELVPSVGGAPFFSRALPPDDRAAAARSDVLTFESQAFTADLNISGAVVADFVVGSTGPSLHVIVKLLDVHPSGATDRLADGAALVAELNSDGDGRAVINLGPIAYRLAAGHRLAMQIASSDFPRYLPHPGTAEDPWSATSVERNRQRLCIGGTTGARLLLLITGPDV